MTKEKVSDNPALEMIKEQGDSGTSKIVTLPNGVRVSILPVSATLLDEVTARIVDPEPPMFFNEKKERDEPNPSDPDYLKELNANDRRRLVASFDVMTALTPSSFSASDVSIERIFAWGWGLWSNAP